MRQMFYYKIYTWQDGFTIIDQLRSYLNPEQVLNNYKRKNKKKLIDEGIDIDNLCIGGA